MYAHTFSWFFFVLIEKIFFRFDWEDNVSIMEVSILKHLGQSQMYVSEHYLVMAWNWS